MNNEIIVSIIRKRYADEDLFETVLELYLPAETTTGYITELLRNKNQTVFGSRLTGDVGSLTKYKGATYRVIRKVLQEQKLENLKTAETVAHKEASETLLAVAKGNKQAAKVLEGIKTEKFKMVFVPDED